MTRKEVKDEDDFEPIPPEKKKYVKDLGDGEKVILPSKEESKEKTKEQRKKKLEELREVKKEGKDPISRVSENPSGTSKTSTKKNQEINKSKKNHEEPSKQLKDSQKRNKTDKTEKDFFESLEPNVEPEEVREWIEERLRNEKHNIGFYISIKSNNKIKHYKVFKDDSRRAFNLLVKAYSKSTGNSPSKLIQPHKKDKISSNELIKAIKEYEIDQEKPISELLREIKKGKNNINLD